MVYPDFYITQLIYISYLTDCIYSIVSFLEQASEGKSFRGAALGKAAPLSVVQ